MRDESANLTIEESSVFMAYAEDILLKGPEDFNLYMVISVV